MAASPTPMCWCCRSTRAREPRPGQLRGARGNARHLAGSEVQEDGLRASHTAEVVLDDRRVPGRCLLGGKEKLDERLARAQEGKKTSTQAAMATFEASRPIVGAQAVGIARAAYEYAVDYAKERKQFGAPSSRTRPSPSSWRT